MKAKFINGQVIVMDHSKWNEAGTEYGLASESEEGYLEFYPSDRPEAEPGHSATSRYEIRGDGIYRVWDVEKPEGSPEPEPIAEDTGEEMPEEVDGESEPEGSPEPGAIEGADGGL